MLCVMTDRFGPNSSPRRRALRAARAVTLGVALGVAGCGTSHTPTPDGHLADGGRPDAARDAGTKDAGTCATPDTSQECCDLAGGFWDGRACAIAVPGPFVPPSMHG